MLISKTVHKYIHKIYLMLHETFHHFGLVSFDLMTLWINFILLYSKSSICKCKNNNNNKIFLDRMKFPLKNEICMFT